MKFNSFKSALPSCFFPAGQSSDTNTNSNSSYHVSFDFQFLNDMSLSVGEAIDQLIQFLDSTLLSLNKNLPEPMKPSFIDKVCTKLEKFEDVATNKELREIVANSLQAVGSTHWILVGFLCVGAAIDRLIAMNHNEERCLRFLQTTCILAKNLNTAKEHVCQEDIRQGLQIIVENVIICIHYIKQGGFTKFLSAKTMEEQIRDSLQEFQYIVGSLNFSVAVEELKLGEKLHQASKYVKASMDDLLEISPVGLDVHVKEVAEKLNVDGSEQALVLIIWGQGGIGKTTLAAASIQKISNLIGQNQFKFSRVKVDNSIKQGTEAHIMKLQEIIVENIVGFKVQFSTTDDGRKGLKKIFEEYSCFLFIDNVNEVGDVDNLLPKELCLRPNIKLRIIITSRHRNVRLELPRVSTVEEFEMKPLELRESELILRNLVLENTTASDSFCFPEEDDMLNEIAKHCFGFPILLSVFGRYARDQRNFKNYTKIINELKKGNLQQRKDRHETIEEMLLFVYHKMYPELQSAFLYAYMLAYHIHISNSKFPMNANSIWDNILLAVGEDEMAELEYRGMIRKEDKRLIIHDIIKLMVEKEATRLWISSPEQCAVSCRDNKVKSILGITLDNQVTHESMHIEISTVDEAHASLQMLSLDGSQEMPIFVNGKCRRVLSQLRCLRICNIRSEGFPFERLNEYKNLRWVEILNSGEINENLLRSLFTLSSIKVLILEGAKDIETLPAEIVNLRSLEVLKLKGFEKLATLPPLTFPHLKVLYLGCKALKCLPRGFENLKSLETLRLSYCESLEKLPEDVRQLVALQKFKMVGCPKIVSLPSGFYGLRSMKEFIIRPLCHPVLPQISSSRS